jgi:hypothetical protein
VGHDDPVPAGWPNSDIDRYSLDRRHPIGGLKTMIALWTDDEERAVLTASQCGSSGMLCEPSIVVPPPEAPCS